MASKESYLNMLPTGIREPLRKLFNSGAILTNAVTGAVIGNVTGNVTGDVTGDIVGKQNLTLQSAEHGAGAIGTAFAPRTYRGYTVNGDILTSIHVDLTGLGMVGTAAEDAIGLPTGGAAYIGRYVTTTYGIVYKVEQIWLEAPGQGTATITSDINITMDDEADIAYDGAVDGGIILNTGGVAAGNTFENLVPALTANDYIYIVEGDTAGTTGVYNAGQFILNLYGHPVLS
ncbi:MAG: hypothetical protein KAV87_50130 [Desulfobacteraceae bacterium]|nr:hypothetical protein [Desulfobacteraceae bacterium]